MKWNHWIGVMLIALAVGMIASSCTVTIGRSITSANYNENSEGSEALNVASPNATNVAREIAGIQPAKANNPTVEVNGSDSEPLLLAGSLFNVQAGNDIVQDKPIQTDAALLTQLGNKDGVTGAGKENTDSKAAGGDDPIEISPDVNVTPVP